MCVSLWISVDGFHSCVPAEAFQAGPPSRLAPPTDVTVLMINHELTSPSDNPNPHTLQWTYPEPEVDPFLFSSSPLL